MQVKRPKFEIGDLVKIKDQLRDSDDTAGVGLTIEMRQFSGKTSVITGISREGTEMAYATIDLDQGRFAWSLGWLIPLYEPIELSPGDMDDLF